MSIMMMNMKKYLLMIGLVMASAPALAAGDAPEPPHQHWHFSGMTGKLDMAAMQRGLKVYREVCAACHSLKRVRYGNLEDLGYTENQTKNIAAEYTVVDGPNEEGEMFDRPGRPSDAFVSPYPNDNAAKSVNNGALPPDLSLITKARPHGSDYLYALLTGYESAESAAAAHGEAAEGEDHGEGAHGGEVAEVAESPEGAEELEAAEEAGPTVIHGVEIPEGKFYNAYFPGHVISMAPPLSDGMVAYEDGSPETVEQYAHDVVNFLAWSADPYIAERKKRGISVLIFLIAFAGVMYAVKRKIWSDVH